MANELNTPKEYIAPRVETIQAANAAAVLAASTQIQPALWD